MCTCGEKGLSRVLPKYEVRHSGDCCKVPIPAVFVNPLDENEKKQLYKGSVPEWRWMKEPRGKMEYRNLKSWYPDYDYYSKRFTDDLLLRQESNFGRTEDTRFHLQGYGPKEI